jgi:hypothetical protein
MDYAPAILRPVTLTVGFYIGYSQTVRIIVKRFKYNEKHSEASWRYYIANNAIPKEGVVSAKGMEKVLQLLVEDGTLTFPLPPQDKYIDNSYLDEARRTLQ